MLRGRARAPLALALATALGGCSRGAPAPPEPTPSAVLVTPAVKPAPQTVTTDALRTLAGGTTFTVPAHWTVEVDGGRARVTAPKGTTATEMSAQESAMIGARMKRGRATARGMRSSLRKSLMPSASGCKRPKGPTRLGPQRFCMRPMTLRSSSTV